MGINFCNLGGGKFLLGMTIYCQLPFFDEVSESLTAFIHIDAILRYLEDPLADGNGLLYNLCAHRASYASLVKDGLFEVFAKILPEYAKGKEKTVRYVSGSRHDPSDKTSTIISLVAYRKRRSCCGGEHLHLRRL